MTKNIEQMLESLFCKKHPEQEITIEVVKERVELILAEINNKEE